MKGGITYHAASESRLTLADVMQEPAKRLRGLEDFPPIDDLDAYLRAVQGRCLGVLEALADRAAGEGRSRDCERILLRLFRMSRE